MKLNKKSFIFTLIFIQIGFILIFVEYTNKSKETIKNGKRLKNIIKRPYNLRNLEWEQLNEYVFFKRTGAYYIIDKQELYMLLVCHKKWIDSKHNKLNVKFIINPKNNSKSIEYNTSNCSLLELFSGYNYYSLSMHCPISFFKNNVNIFDIINQIEVIVEEVSIRKLAFQYPIKLKLKDKNHRMYKKGIAICSKCYRNMNIPLLNFFKWWFELAKQSGYDHITICNNTIPNTKEYNDLFEKYQSYVSIYQLHSWPYFSDNTINYSHVRHDYKSDLLELNRYSRAFFDTININECYLDNFDEYKYISVIDNDEIILPRNSNPNLFSKTAISNFITNLDLIDKNNLNELLVQEAQCSNSIDTYIDRLNISNNTINFRMGYYLNDKSVHKILNEIDIYLNKLNVTSYDKKYFINITDYDSSFIYNFYLNGAKDVKYAQNLIKIYNFLIENNNLLRNYNVSYNRVFYISGDVSRSKCGKAIHDTSISYSIGIHYLNYVTKKEPISTIALDYGHVSHFREIYSIDLAKDSLISIYDLQFDMNYFYCFYQKILEKL